MIFEDQLAAITQDSKKVGTTGDKVDLALLVDGLQSEREQGITIDVAYRFFSTKKRKFIVADSPGHEQYTRNMVTAASNAELAIILIDARNGIMPQTNVASAVALISLDAAASPILTQILTVNALFPSTSGLPKRCHTGLHTGQIAAR